MTLGLDRRVPHDWFDGRVPECVDVDEGAFLESAFSFCDCRAVAPHAVQIARGAHVYSSTIFDLGEQASVKIGEYSILNGARVICDRQIKIGAYAIISWNVFFMDSYRVSLDPSLRREQLIARLRDGATGPQTSDMPALPIRLRDNVWIGFDTCVLPGVTIGEGSIVGARSVVTRDVAPYTIAAGNPARAIRKLPRPAERGH
jgi:acetyltransferase-like isoleucine patch superfamily enzyme